MPTKPRVNLSKTWCFTWHEWDMDHLDHILDQLKDENIKYIIGEESGSEGETRHLQGYLEAPKRIRPIEYLKWPKEVHWEQRKGSRADNCKYCSKEGGKVHSWGLRPIRPLKIVKPTGWQELVVDLVEKEPDDRTIYWFWEDTGKRGKTQLARYLCHTQGAIYLQGAKRHVLATAYQHPECDCFIFGLPRTCEDYVSYESLEALKDGLFHSGFGTDATGMCLRNPPHIVVLANFSPERTKLSEDRWHVREIIGEELVDSV